MSPRWHRLYVVTLAAWLAVAVVVSARGGGPPVLTAALCGAAMVAGYRLAGRMGR